MVSMDLKKGASATGNDSHEVTEGKMFTHSDGDIAAAYADRLEGENAYTRKEEKRLRWKLDMRLVPILWLNITFSAMDKVTTSTAALYGMRTDTNLTGDRYSWVGSAFYFGYLLWCFPSGTILQKLPVAKTMASVQMVWGIVLIGTGFARNFETLIALRVLLGILEAPIVPGNFLVVGMWYSRREAPIRTGLMYTGLSVLFTGPIGYAIGYIPGGEQWRYFFWITGAITCAWAIVVGLLLPDNPVKAKFITERQKAISIDRVRADQTGIENKTFKKDQMIETFLDPKTWLMFFFHIWISIPNGGLTNFAPLIINGLGYSAQRSTLLTMPTGIMQTVSSYMCNGGVFFRLAALYMSYFYLGGYIVGLGMATANTAIVRIYRNLEHSNGSAPGDRVEIQQFGA
ncbi:putative Uncharacterized transporter [Glarea lozoyensis 74030]|uniref:Putative Uncharacterized transporter n=1 Tax=Glarea lozoyensis (strain ATCC 74030 / MF5533) TaxID=1104152 RepID=H0EUR1_GLAL7|nr:putative Uncharacterized transporter [Glarea lozoyensis 74030]